LGLMRKRGLIQKGPKHIQIIDWHGLEEIARGSVN
jgi:hypothetical protein